MFVDSLNYGPPATAWDGRVDADFEYLIVDSTTSGRISTLPGQKGGSEDQAEDQAIGRSRGGLSTVLGHELERDPPTVWYN